MEGGHQPNRTRAAVGRADLVRLLQVAPVSAQALARQLGFDPLAEPAPLTVEDAPEPAPPLPEEPTPAPAAPGPPTFIWRVTDEVQRDLPPPVALPPLLPLPPEGGDLRHHPAPPPLTPWRALWPRIYALIADHVPGHAPDVPHLVRHLAQGRPLARVPRRHHHRWPARLTLWIDRHLDRVPLWDDQDLVRRHLARWCPAITEHLAPTPPRPGETALLLGDLTALPGAQRLARCAEHTGARLAALTPRPAPRRGWRTALWQTPLATAGTRDERTHRLLTLAATLPWVRPGLLRALRQRLPAAQADITTELDVWTHPAVAARAPDGLVVDPHHARTLRRTAPTDEGLRRLIEQWHGHLPQSIRHLDALLWTGTDPLFDPAAARHHFARIRDHLLGGRSPALVPFARLASAQLLSARDHHPELQALVNLLWHAGHAGREAAVPEGIEPTGASIVNPGPPTTWHLQHAEGHLHLTPQPRGLVLARVQSTQPVAWVRHGEQRRQQRLDTPIELDDSTRIELATDLSTVVLEKLERPVWAEAFGVERGRAWAELQMDGATRRLWAEGTGWAGEGGYGADGFGVFHVTEVKGQRLRMRLIPAGEFLMGSPAEDTEAFNDERPQHPVRLTESFWLAEVPVTQALWQAVLGQNPSRFKGADRPVEDRKSVV